MNWLRTISREFVGLVVDDVGFAAAFFVGLAAILLESVVRRAGASR